MLNPRGGGAFFVYSYFNLTCVEISKQVLQLKPELLNILVPIWRLGLLRLSTPTSGALTFVLEFYFVIYFSHKFSLIHPSFATSPFSFITIPNIYLYMFSLHLYLRVMTLFSLFYCYWWANYEHNCLLRRKSCKWQLLVWVSKTGKCQKPLLHQIPSKLHSSS